MLLLILNRNDGKRVEHMIFKLHASISNEKNPTLILCADFF